MTKIVGWNDPTTDTTGSFNGTTDEFTVPQSGYYDINFGAQISGEVAPFEISAIYAGIFIDGTEVRSGGHQSRSGLGESILNVGADGYYLSKGQVLHFSIRYDNGDATNTLLTNSKTVYFDIAKRSSGQAILENETVAMRYTSNAGSAVANNTNTVVLFEDKDTDTHGAYDPATGIYTFHTSGYYAVDCKVALFGRDSANSTRVFIASSVDGSGAEDIVLDTEAAAGSGAYNAFTLDGSYVKYFNKGQTINVFINQI